MRQTNPQTGIGFPEPVGSEFCKILLACVFELPGGCQCGCIGDVRWRECADAGSDHEHRCAGGQRYGCRRSRRRGGRVAARATGKKSEAAIGAAVESGEWSIVILDVPRMIMRPSHNSPE
jgi:hypothetical protein